MSYEKMLTEKNAIEQKILQLEEELCEKQAIDLYLKHRETHPNRAEALLKDKSEFRILISTQLNNLEQEIIDWQNSPYEENENYPLQKVHKTDKIYYYEHFGRMDDASYCKKAYAKMELYTLNGIIPTMQLLITYETSDNPLTPEVVEQLVRQYFLEE